MNELIVEGLIQGSPEWLQQRMGMLTSSRIADVVKKAKRESTGELQCRKDLKLDLAVERVTNRVTEHWVSFWMERGAELEPLARAAYELRADAEVQQVGFVFHPTMKWAGCSPDGFIGEDGLVELKCPKTTTHAEYLIGKCVPEQYIPQMMWQMACCPDRQWVDFVSYHPDFPAPLDVFVCRLKRDDKQIAAMESEAEKFLAEVEAVKAAIVEDSLVGRLEASIAQARMR